MSAAIQGRNLSVSNEFKIAVESPFPMPSVEVLEENLSYPEIIQGIPRLVVTGQKRFSHYEDQIRDTQIT